MIKNIGSRNSAQFATTMYHVDMSTKKYNTKPKNRSQYFSIFRVCLPERKELSRRFTLFVASLKTSKVKMRLDLSPTCQKLTFYIYKCILYYEV